MSQHHISDTITLEEVRNILEIGLPVTLSEHSKAKVLRCREYLEEKLGVPGKLMYGINTGFGYLQDVEVQTADLEQLQENLLMSHACGTGELVPEEITRMMLLLKIQGLSLGHSGISMETLNTLISIYNKGLVPVVYQQGSLGASGDLAPLSHLCLPLTGRGHIWQNGEIRPAAEVLKSAGIAPIRLKAKEGLALINGTQFMSSYGVYLVNELRRWIPVIHATAALSADAFLCRQEPFWPQSHHIRPHQGQIRAAEWMLHWLKGSQLAQTPRPAVQDAYSFRCIPQVHGACLDVLERVEHILQTEISSVTDNPLIFPDEDLILSGGNFHGETLALHLDFLAMAMAELASISERRIYKLISGERGLPPFLVAKPGLNSGLMIAQYTAAGIVSQNKQLCTPASVDSIVSSNGQEDHVSMGANAATKCYRVFENLKTVIGIEWLCATQAAGFREAGSLSPGLLRLTDAYREVVPFIETDRELYPDIAVSLKFLQRIAAERYQTS